MHLKLIFLFSFIYYVASLNVLELTDKELLYLQNMKFDDLPLQVRQYIQNTLQLTVPGQNKNCCAQPLSAFIETQQYTTIGSFTYGASYAESYKEACGWWGWGTKYCTYYRLRYSTAVGYQTLYHYRSVQNPCPSQYKICCKDMLNLAQFCIPLSFVDANPGYILEIFG